MTLWRRRMDNSLIRFYRKRNLFSVWSNNWLPSAVAPLIRAEKPDIVHLHWLGDGALNWSELDQFKVPVVWTLHDPWAFTGGCHYPAGCRRFMLNCGECPQLGSRQLHDLSWWNLRRKKRNVDAVSRWIAPSRWMGVLASQGGILMADRLKVIPNGLDGQLYKRLNGQAARLRLGIADDMVVLVTGAADLSEPRKGVYILPEMLRKLQGMISRRVVVLMVGEVGELSGIWPAEFIWTGSLSTTEELSEVYSMADVFILPSLQDNLPNVVLEALACGCPTVGFNSGGLTDIISNGVTGWVADRIDAGGLALAIYHWLLTGTDRDVTAEVCRRQFDASYTLERHGANLMALYKEVLEEKRLGL